MTHDIFFFYNRYKLYAVYMVCPSNMGQDKKYEAPTIKSSHFAINSNKITASDVVKDVPTLNADKETHSSNAG